MKQMDRRSSDVNYKEETKCSNPEPQAFKTHDCDQLRKCPEPGWTMLQNASRSRAVGSEGNAVIDRGSRCSQIGNVSPPAPCIYALGEVCSRHTHRCLMTSPA